MELPQYIQRDSGISLGPTPQADTRPRDERSSSLAPGLNALSQGLNSLVSGQQYAADALQRQQEQQDLTRTAIAISGAHAELTQSMQAQGQDILSPPDGVMDPNKFNDFTGGMNKTVNAAFQKIADQATTQKGKDLALKMGASVWADHYLPKAMALQAQAGVQFARTNLDGTLKNALWGISNDWSTFGTYHELYRQVVDESKGLPLSERQKAMEVAESQMAWTATNAAIRANPAAVAVATRGPLARQPALAGLTSAYDSGAPIVGTPIEPDTGPPPKEIQDQIIAAKAAGMANVWTAKTGLLLGPAAEAYQKAANTPKGVVAAVEPPPTPPTDAEIASKIPAWKYLTPEHQQQFRNTATTLMNQQGARDLTQSNQYLQDSKAAAKNFVPDPDPKPSSWFVQRYGVNSREEQEYAQWQLSAHVAQKMLANPDGENIALAESVKPKGIGNAESWQAYNMVSALARSTNKEQATVLHNEIEQQKAKALNRVDPGPPLPVSRFTSVGQTADDHTAYLQDLAVWKTNTDAASLTDSELQAKLAEQKVTASSPDAIKQNERYSLLYDTAKRIADARDKDPAAFLVNTNPGIKDLYTKANQTNNPLDWNAYFQASRSEQLRLTGKYMLTNQADRQAWSQMLTQPFTGENAGDQAVARVKKLRDLLGPNYPEVATEMQGDSKNPIPDWAVATFGTNSPVWQEKFARLGTMNLKEMENTIPKDAVSAIKGQVLQSFTPLFQSLGVTPGNEGPMATLLNMATKGAIADVRGGGLDPTNAAKRNAEAFVNEYTYFPNRGKGDSNNQFAVPNDQEPAKVNMGAELALSKLSQLTIPIPPDMTGLYKSAEAEKEYKLDVMKAPVWMLNKNGDGLILSTVNRLGGTSPVYFPNGERFGYSFEALRNMVESSPNYGAGLQQQERMKLDVRKANPNLYGRP